MSGVYTRTGQSGMPPLIGEHPDPLTTLCARRAITGATLDKLIDFADADISQTAVRHKSSLRAPANIVCSDRCASSLWASCRRQSQKSPRALYTSC
jgi:hypothetical protein